MSYEQFPDFDHSAQQAEQAMYSNLGQSQKKSELAAKLDQLQLRYESEYCPKERETWQSFGELFDPECTDVEGPDMLGRSSGDAARQWYVTTAQDNTPIAVELLCTARHSRKYSKQRKLFAKSRHTRLVEETIKNRDNTDISFYNILPGSTGYPLERRARDGNYLTPIMGAGASMEKPILFQLFVEEDVARAVKSQALEEIETQKSESLPLGPKNISRAMRHAAMRNNPMRWLFNDAGDNVKGNMLYKMETKLQLMDAELDRIQSLQELVRGAKPEPRGYFTIPTPKSISYRHRF